MNFFFYQFHSSLTFLSVIFGLYYFNKLEKQIKTLINYSQGHFLLHIQIPESVFQLIFYQTTKY